jgi:3-dehydroquinate synthase
LKDNNMSTNYESEVSTNLFRSFVVNDFQKTDIYFGDISKFSDLFSRQFESVVVLIDFNVAELWGEKIMTTLSKVKILKVIIVTAGEKAKSWSVYIDIINQLQDLPLKRRDGIVVIGGGVVCDLGGFVASTFMRGIPYIMIPTTLISIADAAHGGKVGINLDKGKNLLGTFYSSLFTIVDTSFLNSLSKREITQGMAEIIKIAIIANDSVFYEHLESISYNSVNIFQSPEKLTHAIKYSINKKLELVEPDWREANLDRLLNLGHEIAHGLEKTLNFESEIIKHGEAVAIGIATCVRFSRSCNFIESEDSRRIINLLVNFGLPVTYYFPAKLQSEFQSALLTQQRVRNGELRLVLPNKYFSSFIYHGDAVSQLPKFLQ